MTFGQMLAATLLALLVAFMVIGQLVAQETQEAPSEAAVGPCVTPGLAQDVPSDYIVVADAECASGARWTPAPEPPPDPVLVLLADIRNLLTIVCYNGLDEDERGDTNMLAACGIRVLDGEGEEDQP